MRLIKYLKLLALAACAIVLSSCATRQPPVQPMPPAAVYPPVAVARHNLFHTVGPGETLWRIGRIYDVSIEEIMRANNLRSADSLVMGANLLIPQALPARSVVPLYPSNKWEYIIIHHSATDYGNSLSFHYAHSRRGFSGGLGYHFVIDNGTTGKPNGYIEISPRWIKQQDGAHCKAADMNIKGIGICMVGNYSEGDISPEQLSSLVHLVKILRNFYRIPLKNIIGHGQVPGANTECPGKKFPWQRFIAMLKEAG